LEVALGAFLVAATPHGSGAEEPAISQGRAKNPGPSAAPERPDVKEKEVELEGPAEAEAPPEAIDERPGRRFRPFIPPVLTPEQQQEAERLKRLAALFGTDPTAIVGRVQFSSRYDDLPDGGRLSDTVARVDLPFRNNWLLRMDLPFVRWSDPDRPATTSAQGVSDLAVNAGWRAYDTPEYAVLIGATSTFPTAAENSLGFGKYAVGPLLATARFLPRIHSFLFGVVSHQLSVGGDPGRPDVEFTRAIVQLNTIWSDRWWTIAQGVWKVDWERNAKSSMTAEFEVGGDWRGNSGCFSVPESVSGGGTFSAPTTGASKSACAICSARSEPGCHALAKNCVLERSHNLNSSVVPRC
jgi:hypothetical protein